MVNLVYQCEIDDVPNKEWVKLSSLTAKKYAERFSCDYILNDSMSLPDANPMENFWERNYNILDIIYDEKYEKYDDVLYLDTDILISSSSENIFEAKDRDNHTDVMGVTKFPKWHPWEMYHNHYKKFGSRLVKSKTPNIKVRTINTGVIVFTKKGREKARRTWDVHWKDWIAAAENLSLAGDDPYINAMMNKHRFNVIELGEKWNYFIRDSHDDTKAYFYHFCGGDRKRRDEIVLYYNKNPEQF